MSAYINTLVSMIQRDPKYSVRGPVLQSQRYDSNLQQHVHLLDCECMHGAYARNGFGYFIEVTNERNTNKSRLQIRLPFVEQLTVLTVESLDPTVAGLYYGTEVGGTVFVRLNDEGVFTTIERKANGTWAVHFDRVAFFLYTTSDNDKTNPALASWPVGFTVTSSTENVPYFRVRERTIASPNEFICKLVERRQIVPIGTQPDSGTDVWESQVLPIDEVHEEKVTSVILSKTVLSRQAWDEQLNQEVSETRELVQTSEEPSIVESDGVITHTYYEQVKCGWYVKHTDVFNSSISSYSDSDNFYWPPVLKLDLTVTGSVTGLVFAPITGKACVPASGDPCDERDTDIEYPVRYATSVRIKEAYNDVCRVDITEGFVLSVAPGSLVNEVMIPEAVNYDGLIQDFKLAPTLHGSFGITENITSHPNLVTPMSRSVTFPATNQTDWPNTITRQFARPYRKGFILTTKVYHKPS